MSHAVTDRPAPPMGEHDPIARAMLEESLSGIGLAAAGANVIMQLSMLPVGHGVASSRVDSGRVDKHPIKRARTTLAYLAVALLGTEDERSAMRSEVDRQHRQVRSRPGDPVRYNAFDTELQLWVAACLYKGTQDIERVAGIHRSEEEAERIYRYCARLGTTLQVRPEQWPADRAAFARWWDEKVDQIEMDDLTRTYLQGIAKADFVGRPWSTLLGPLAELQAVGFLPERFRAELGLPWNHRHQRAFDAMMKTWAAVDRHLPGPVRRLPFNAYLWDTRRRIRRGKPIV
ncbi:MAG TPA: oxygenase MpaB family protein [Acidimicrobiales bacterium]|nr:oxygenase MpaB family protein [Acidimicrobiales bacterium]